MMRKTIMILILIFSPGSSLFASSSDSFFVSAPDGDNFRQVPVPPEIPELGYSSGENVIRLTWSTIAEETPDSVSGEIDFVGYRVYRSAWEINEWKLLTEFDTNNLRREYVDSSVNENIPYYYSVTAFDTEGLESPKTNYLKDEKGSAIPVYISSSLTSDLNSVRVVPNPYYGSASGSTDNEDKIRFINLPPDCRILIFTLSGNFIKEIRHSGDFGVEEWNLKSKSDIKVSSGLYVYKVEKLSASSVEIQGTKIGKFLIMR